MDNESQNEINDIKTEHYELLYILPMSYTEEETKPIKDKVNNLIKEHDGQITKEDNLGKQKFAYNIKTFSHGYYLLAEFDLPTANLADLNRALQLTPEVIRYLFTKKKIKTQKDIDAEVKLQSKLAKQKEKEIDKIKEDKVKEKDKPAKSKDEGKVSLEDLDKKLDEILDTDKII